MQISRAEMRVLLIPNQPPTYNYENDEATGFSSDDDYCDDDAPGPPTSTRKWEICKLKHSFLK